MDFPKYVNRGLYFKKIISPNKALYHKPDSTGCWDLCLSWKGSKLIGVEPDEHYNIGYAYNCIGDEFEAVSEDEFIRLNSYCPAKGHPLRTLEFLIT